MDELIEIATRILSQHWRDPSTNMSLDRQRMLAGHVVPVIAAAAWDEGYAAAQLEWEHIYDGHTIDPDVDDQMCTECGKGNPYE